MPVISSEAVIDAAAQPGGGRYVMERHTMDTGALITSSPYVIPEGFDMAARLAAQAAAINAQLAEQEAAALMGE